MIFNRLIIKCFIQSASSCFSKIFFNYSSLKKAPFATISILNPDQNVSINQIALHLAYFPPSSAQLPLEKLELQLSLPQMVDVQGRAGRLTTNRTRPYLCYLCSRVLSI
uniref:(northern house mosquito) hypothetical protein n=1 Tax=Culex pipiens TaxID=7175 RepID=A0A8D8KS84_CULPI